MHFCIFKRNETLDVLLLPHKGTNMYSFVNLSKGHICPCLFPSIDAAIADLDDRQKRGLILKYDVTKSNCRRKPTSLNDNPP